MPDEAMALETEHKMATPKYATRRDPSAPTDGARIARIAQAIGKPFMPWQRLVVDVATEREDSGAYRYEIVMVTVPRQSGKTTLVGPVQLDRVIMNSSIKAFYTAQTGKDARSRFNDLVKLVQASPLRCRRRLPLLGRRRGDQLPERVSAQDLRPGRGRAPRRDPAAGHARRGVGVGRIARRRDPRGRDHPCADHARRPPAGLDDLHRRHRPVDVHAQVGRPRPGRQAADGLLRVGTP
jgi:hypothetical protein